MNKSDFFIKKAFRKIIPLIYYYTYEDLQILDTLWISDVLSKREINNLKYLNQNAKIEFDYYNYEYILQFLKNVDIENEIIIGIDNKEKFNQVFLFKDLGNFNLKKVSVMLSDNSIYPLSEYLRYEQTLYEMVKPALNLSPLEKFIYSFDLVKHFKEYKECDDESMLSRDLYNVLDNDYCVCVGYISLLNDLLNKMNINSVSFYCDVDDSYENVDINQINFDKVVLTRKIKHSRLYVYIKDDKYNVNGIYITDPTYDNILGRDYYTHLLFTEKKNEFSRDYEWLDARIIFCVRNMDEYNEKFAYLTMHKKCEIDLINYILCKLMVLDPTSFKCLKEKYDYIDNDYGVIIYNADVSKLKYDLGKYIVFMFNNEIDKKNIKRAIEFVYQEFDLFGSFENCNEALKEVFEYNKEREERLFPKRYNIDEYGNKELMEGYKKILKK